MGLLQKAYETYNFHEDEIGIYKSGKEPFAPISHISAKADIEITINQDGNFVSASFLKNISKDKIIIPVTEESSGRTSGCAPHPLCDQLCYLAKYNEKKHNAYVKNLEEWCLSEYSVPKLQPILEYVKNGTILNDLVESKIIVLKPDGKPKNEKLLVRWIVIGLGEENSGPCWKDKKLFKCFEDYYLNRKESGKKVLCMITGKTEPPANQHLKGIVSKNGNAKLISCNDESNFTYRGRFTNQNEAQTVSYTASQKIHNVLKWIISNQGVYLGSRVYICWEPHKLEQPGMGDPFISSKEDERIMVPSEYQEKLFDTLKGWKSKLPNTAEAIIVSFDAATSGRLSLTYYNELRESDFLERLLYWDSHCCCNGKFGIQSPSIKNIVDYAFGVERNNKIETDDNIIKQQYDRLIKCRIEKGRMPFDIVKALVQKASNPLAYSKNKNGYRKNYDKLLFTACAVIKKYRFDIKNEDWKMALDSNKKDRSYQFGRILAILEKAEKDVIESSDSKRDTNAERMQLIFSQRPMYAYKIIWERVKNAYYPKLKESAKVKYEKLIEDAMEIITEFPENELNRPLTETYILGYYLQKKELYTKKENKEVVN